MTSEVLLNPEQLHELLSALKPDTSSVWPSSPIFWAAFLAMGSGIMLDQIRRWFDSRKAMQERYEKELELINIVTTGVARNIELLLHAINQQIIPPLRSK
jgi:hypothetical protein